MKNLTKETFKIFWKHLLEYKWAVVLIVISVIIANVGSILGYLLYKDFFDALVDTSNIELLKIILFKILVIYAVSWIFWRIAEYTTVYFQTNIMANLSNYCFAYLHKHSITFFNNNFVGSLVKRVNRFARSFEAVVDSIIWEFFQITINIGLIVIILSKRNIYLGLGVLTWVVIYILMSYYFSLYKLKYDIKRTELNSKVTGVLADTITNQLNIKLFTGYNRENKLFKKVNSELQKIRKFAWNLATHFNGFQAFLMIVLEIGIMYYTINLWSKGVITIGDIVLIQTFLIQITRKLWGFGRIIRYFYENLAEAHEMTEILITPHDIKDSKSAKPLKINRGEIKFKNVDFAYNKTNKVIRNFNLDIKSKEKIGVVGASGSGKSTLINLLLRNYEIGKGKILIDGQKIYKVTKESLWKNISLVNQDPILFHRTLKENIKYGKPNTSDKELYNAAKLANAHRFIINFQDKYNTFVGERGVKLSGGERQRVAIARAILKNSPILVLDEATSSLDSESEGLIQDALSNLMKDKTVIVIAHRLSTIMKMDRIVVIDKGRIVEEGKHSVLIKKENGIYRKLWEKQAGGFIK